MEDEIRTEYSENTENKQYETEEKTTRLNLLQKKMNQLIFFNGRI